MKLKEIVLAGALFLGGCEFSPWSEYNPYNNKIGGENELVQIAKVERDNLEEEFGVDYKKDLYIYYTGFGSMYRPDSNEIMIDKSMKDNPAIKEHIRHELTEAISWEINGFYEEGYQFQKLNGHKIEDIIPSWNLGYRGIKNE